MSTLTKLKKFKEEEKEKEYITHDIYIRLNLSDYEKIYNMLIRLDKENRYIEINIDNEYYPTSDDSGENIDLLTILLSKDDIKLKQKKEFINLLFYTFNETLEPYKLLIKKNIHNNDNEENQTLLNYVEDKLQKNIHLLKKQTKTSIIKAKNKAKNEELLQQEKGQKHQQAEELPKNSNKPRKTKKELTPEEIKQKQIENERKRLQGNRERNRIRQLELVKQMKQQEANKTMKRKNQLNKTKRKLSKMLTNRQRLASVDIEEILGSDKYNELVKYYKDEISNNNTHGKNSVCQTIQKYTPTYYIPNRNSNEDKIPHILVCCIFHFIGILNKVLSIIKHKIKIVLKGGRALQLLTRNTNFKSESFDIDIMIKHNDDDIEKQKQFADNLSKTIHNLYEHILTPTTFEDSGIIKVAYKVGHKRPIALIDIGFKIPEGTGTEQFFKKYKSHGDILYTKYEALYLTQTIKQFIEEKKYINNTNLIPSIKQTLLELIELILKRISPNKYEILLDKIKVYDTFNVKIHAIKILFFYLYDPSFNLRKDLYDKNMKNLQTFLLNSEYYYIGDLYTNYQAFIDSINDIDNRKAFLRHLSMVLDQEIYDKVQEFFRMEYVLNKNFNILRTLTHYYPDLVNPPQNNTPPMPPTSTKRKKKTRKKGKA